MIKELEESNGKLARASDVHENIEKELREALDLLRNKEHELYLMSTRFTELQAEVDELQTEKTTLAQSVAEQSQTCLTLKTDKEEAKEFVEILQKQTDELIRQIEDYNIKMRQTEDFIEALTNVKPSVSDKDISMYLEWNATFGSGSTKS